MTGAGLERSFKQIQHHSPPVTTALAPGWWSFTKFTFQETEYLCSVLHKSPPCYVDGTVGSLLVLHAGGYWIQLLRPSWTL